jgi:uncharacterized protein (DUF433 family)
MLSYRSFKNWGLDPSLFCADDIEPTENSSFLSRLSRIIALWSGAHEILADNAPMLAIKLKDTSIRFCIRHSDGSFYRCRFTNLQSYFNLFLMRSNKKGNGSMNTNELILCSSEVLGGTPVFSGTRVPVKNLIDYLEAGDSLDDFLEDFPSVSREQAVLFLELAKEALMAQANASSNR